MSEEDKNKARDKYKNLSEEDKYKKGNMQEIDIIICPKKIKIKKKNMEKIGIIICLKKKRKN